MLRKSGLVVLLASLLGGCAFHPQLRQVALDHNAMLAEAEDQLTLLNIVRASERFPMHFTAITSLRGGASLTTSAEIGSSFPEAGGDTSFDAAGKLSSSKATIGAHSFSPKLSGSLTTNPTFDMVVLSNEKFQRGIQQPVTTEFIEYLLQQGWRDDLVMALMVEKIEGIASHDQGPYKKGDLILELSNANAIPGNPNTEDEANSRKWRCFLIHNRMQPRKTPRKTVDLIDVATVIGQSSIADILTLDGKTFDIAPPAEGTSLRAIQRISPSKTAIGFVERRSANQHAECSSDSPTAVKLVAQGNVEQVRVAPTVTRGSRRRPASAQPQPPQRNLDVQAGIATVDGKSYEVDLVPILRSTQGVLYFLGEYSRSNQENRYPLASGYKVFSLAQGSGEAAISVQFRGKRYFIREGDGASLQVLDAVQQLLNLQKSADELPKTQTVNVVR